MGFTNSVQPYCKFATIAMQTIPMNNCNHRFVGRCPPRACTNVFMGSLLLLCGMDASYFCPKVLAARSYSRQRGGGDGCANLVGRILQSRELGAAQQV